jgi:outer membrane immunogenic protein
MCVVAFTLVAAAAADDTNFKGFYVGANVGGAFGSSGAHTAPAGPGNYFADSSVPAIAQVGAQQLDDRGITGGGTIGYNWHAQNGFVFGFEADMGVMRLEDAAIGIGTYPCCAPETFVVAQGVSTDWLFTARPRVGYAANNWLLYGTIGVAVTNLDYVADFSDDAGATETAAISEKKPGWAMGAGVEYALPNTHWSFKGEYMFLRFGDSKVTSTNFDFFGPDPGTPFLHKTDLSVHSLRFGANYRF